MSNKQELFDKVRNSVVDFDLEGIKNATQGLIQANVNAEQIIDVMGEGMNIVSEKYENEESLMNYTMQDYFRKFSEIVASVVDGEPELHLYTEIC